MGPVRPSTWLTSGMKGACSIPASSRLKLIERKRGWALTSLAPPPRQPSRWAGSLVRSCGTQRMRCRRSDNGSKGQDWDSAHLPAQGLGILRELVWVALLHLPHQLLHLLPLDFLLALLEGRLALDHLVHQAAQRPPVGAEGVALVLHHLRSCRGSDVRLVSTYYVGKCSQRLLTHVSHCPHPPLDGLALWDVHGQTKVWYPDVTWWGKHRFTAPSAVQYWNSKSLLAYNSGRIKTT